MSDYDALEYKDKEIEKCYWCKCPKSEHTESDVGLKCPDPVSACDLGRSME